MKKNDKLLSMLDWNNSVEEQQKGVLLAENVKDLTLFLQPNDVKYNKNVWDNCAKILFKKSDDDLKPYLIQLLEWLEDLNWPGALIILERLINYGDVNSLSFVINKCVDQAIFPDEIIWLCNIGSLIEANNLLKLLISNKNLSKITEAICSNNLK